MRQTAMFVTTTLRGTSYLKIDVEARGILCGLTLIKASLSAETPTLTWQLQTGVLPPDLREKATEKVHDIQVEL